MSQILPLLHQSSVTPLFYFCHQLHMWNYKQAFKATPSSNLCTLIHIVNPNMPITMMNLHSIHIHKTLFIPTIFHHLRIMATSQLIPHDRTIYVTADQIDYPLTIPSKSHQDIWHDIQLFLNPHNRLPYYLYTHKIDEDTIHHLMITTTLPCKTQISRESQCRLMMRTESHAPDRITTLTFPTTSVTHQLFIMTLVDHLLLSVPNTNTRQSWKIVRENVIHEHTMQLILVTATLKIYHKV